MKWDFASVFANTDALLVGAAGTLRIFALCLVLGLGLGLVVGLGRYARAPWLYWPATAFVEFFRNIPALVQIFWWYYALPVLTGIQGSAFAASAVALTLYSTAYLAEIYRSGIECDLPGHHDVDMNGVLPVRFDRIWEAARAVDFHGQEAFVMAPEDLLLSLCINSCRKRYFRLKHLFDIAETVHRLDLDWNRKRSAEYFARLRTTSRGFAHSLGGKFADNPIWFLRRVITVHPLGGAPMGRTPGEGVVDSYGNVFGHPGLHIADGSVMPGPTGPNPSFTIAALADRFADQIIDPDRRAAEAAVS